MNSHHQHRHLAEDESYTTRPLLRGQPNRTFDDSDNTDDDDDYDDDDDNDTIISDDAYLKQRREHRRRYDVERFMRHPDNELVDTLCFKIFLIIMFICIIYVICVILFDLKKLPGVLDKAISVFKGKSARFRR